MDTFLDGNVSSSMIYEGKIEGERGRKIVKVVMLKNIKEAKSYYQMEKEAQVRLKRIKVDLVDTCVINRNLQKKKEIKQYTSI